MTWGVKHPLERLVEWFVPATLASAMGWSALQLGAGAVQVAVVALIGLVLAGWVITRLGGKQSLPWGGFEPADLPEFADGELLLDDPLGEVPADSRVVRLFAPAEPSVEQTPGQLVERIADFLEARPRPQLVAQSVPQIPVDASAALHMALANIRASLR